ncbi:MAG: gas vesicle protein [Dehalococcoidia bacterium]
MQPTRDTHATLVDLLDRVLEKGLVLNADLLIHVAGIPLLGVNLRACLAGIETMLKYGIWQDWDEAQRAIANRERQQKRAQCPMNTLGLEPEQNPGSLPDNEIAKILLSEEEVKI